MSLPPEAAPESRRRDRSIGANLPRRNLPAAIGWLVGWAAVIQMLALFPSGTAKNENAPNDDPWRAAFWSFEQAWAWEEVRDAGALPLWNPYRMGGLPLIPSSDFRPFYPPRWIEPLLAAGGPLRTAWLRGFPLLLAAALAAWVCRRLQFGWTAAGLAGLSWMLSGALAARHGLFALPELHAAAWMPPAIYGATIPTVDREGRRRSVLISSAALAAQALGGAFSIFVVTLYAWGAARILTGLWPRLAPHGADAAAPQNRPEFPLKTRAKLLAGTGAATVFVALAFSAVSWIPAREFHAMSLRQNGLAEEASLAASLQEGERWSWALPYVPGAASAKPECALSEQGGCARAEPGASPEQALPVSWYVGAGVLYFALFALAASGSRRGFAWLAAALAVPAWLLASGDAVPGLHAAARAALPGFRRLRAPADWMLPAALALILAAAAGLQEFLDPTPSRRRRKVFSPAYEVEAQNRMKRKLRIRASVALSAFACASVAALWIVASDARRERLAPLLFLAEGLFPLLLFAGAHAYLRSLNGRRFLSAGLLAALVLCWGVDLGRNVLRARPVMPDVREDRPVRALTPEQLESLGLGIDYRQRHRPLRVYDARGTHAVRYSQTKPPIELHSVGHLRSAAALGGYAVFQQVLGPTHPNFLRLFAVDLVLAESRAAAEQFLPPGEFAFAGMADDMAVFRRNRPVYVRQVRHRRPVASKRELIDRLSDPGFNPLESTLHLTAGASAGADPPERDMTLEAEVLPSRPGVAAVRYSARLEGSVQLSEPAVPGWRIELDGAPLRGAREVGEAVFLGLRLPAGRHVLRLTYDPASLRLGLYVSLLALGALGFTVGAALHRRLPPIAQPGDPTRRGRVLPTDRREGQKARPRKIWELDEI